MSTALVVAVNVVGSWLTIVVANTNFKRRLKEEQKAVWGSEKSYLRKAEICRRMAEEATSRKVLETAASGFLWPVALPYQLVRYFNG